MSIDLQTEALKIQLDYCKANNLPTEETERMMENRQEYLQGCRENNIKALLRQESINDLVDRFFEYASPNTVQELKDFIIDKCAENNFIEEEELQ